MKHAYIHNEITSPISLKEALLHKILTNCNMIHVKKGNYVQRSGEREGQSFYVKKGLLRYYSIDEKGKEHILQFAPEGWFISDWQRININEHSDFFMDVLEDSEVFIVNTAFILEKAKENHEFLEINNQLLQNHIRQLQNRINQLLSYTAEQRYLEFVKTYPDIMLRVPQWMVASYLGITPESLSRVRKDLAERNQVNS
ncbi:MAG: Crp/Fnr family transcriptional regulator [Niabella sp.]